MLTSVFASFSVFAPFQGLEPEKPRKTAVLTAKHMVFTSVFLLFVIWGCLRVEIMMFFSPWQQQHTMLTKITIITFLTIITIIITIITTTTILITTIITYIHHYYFI